MDNQDKIAEQAAKIDSLRAALKWYQAQAARRIGEAARAGIAGAAASVPPVTLSHGWVHDRDAAFNPATGERRPYDFSPTSAPQPTETAPAAFKNFHRALCDRFNYTHDEQFWWRDQVSLIEHIAASVPRLAVPQGYVLALETVVELPGGKKELGYTLLSGIGIFTTAEEVHGAIAELSLPLGWVSMTTSQLLPGWMLPAAPAAPLPDQTGPSEAMDAARAACEDEIVGHKTFSAEGGGFRHEPLRRSEADAIMAQVEASERRRTEMMPDELTARRVYFDAWLRLKKLGWNEAIYCPKDGSEFEVIEAGSTGVHRCVYQGEWPSGSWWILGDGDMYPSHPVLYRRISETASSPASRVGSIASKESVEPAAPGASIGDKQ